MMSTRTILCLLLILPAVILATCPRNAKYRTLDGTCNNVDHKNWGAAGQPYIRLIPPQYEDEGNGTVPRLTGTNDDYLASPREVSVAVHGDTSDLDRRDTLMVMQWGQLVDHDMTLTPKPAKGDCCKDFNADFLHTDVENGGDCFPIAVPETDKNFKKCMEFMRSRTVMVSGKREQKNAITAFLDGSATYGSSDSELKALRKGTSAYMKTKDGLLPTGRDDSCKRTHRRDRCFHAGDARANAFPGLSLLHTILLKEHNRIADNLRDVRPDDTEDELFDEARKIVSAFYQQITYREFLPLVLGDNTMEEFALGVDEHYEYNNTLNPSIFNNFATAALRFGHSLLTRELYLRDMRLVGSQFAPFDRTDLPNRAVLIEEVMNQNTELIDDLESVLKSIVYARQEKADIAISAGMTNHMFETKDIAFDIASLNIQRGRDHGLPGYNDFREACGLRRVPTFDDEAFVTASGDAMSTVYDSTDDIDLWTGGLAEQHVSDGGVGPLFACLLGLQFHNVKFGDSFWYQTRDPNKGFTQWQLQEIEKVYLSTILCLNSDVGELPHDVFQRSDSPPDLCSTFDTMDFDAWER